MQRTHESCHSIAEFRSRRRSVTVTVPAPRPPGPLSTSVRPAALLPAAALLGALLLTACGGADDPASADSRAGGAAGGFVERAEEAGLRHVHRRPYLDPKLDNIMSWMTSVGAAAATADFDRDGWLDLFFTNSHRGEPSYLYRNNGDGTFSDVAEQAGLAATNDEGGVGMDAVWGDIDNDGWPDLYIVRWGRDLLYRNNGDGTFNDITGEVFVRADGSPGSEWKNGCAAIFLDYDLDGRLDVYVGNYFDDHDLWALTTTRIMHDDFERARNAGRNQLFHQLPDGRFEEVAPELGVDDPGWTLAVGSADLDNDGWPDLYSADDFGPDQLYMNRGEGRFENVTETAIGYDTKKGMNVDFGDFNNDGWLDIYVTNITTAEYLQEGNMLWHNNGPAGGFTTAADTGGAPAPAGLSLTDISLDAGTYDGGWGWGAKFLDHDLDGDLDLIAVNGFLSAGEESYWYDLASWTVTESESADAANWPPIEGRSFSGYEPTRFWVNDGFSSFTERAEQLGIASDRDGRGVVAFDYDNDGDLDVLLANQHQAPELFENRGTPGNHWLMVRLIADPATGTNRDAVHTRVTVVTAAGQQIRERDGGNGYSGQSDPRLHFGLGGQGQVDLLEVRWPDGGLQYLENVAADQVIEVRQDPSAYADRVQIEPDAPRPVARQRQQASATPHLEPEVFERRAAEIERQLATGQGGFALSSTYRQFCAEQGQHDRAIEFLTELVEEHPESGLYRIELAAAYVDKLPTCGGVAAIICKGRNARRSLDQFDAVLAAQPRSWVGYFGRGINHLHWPRALRHSDDAARDLEQAARMQDAVPADRAPAAFIRTWVALGDAYAKAGDYDDARDAWRRGLERYPENDELTARLAIAEDRQILAYVEEQRSLEAPIDTDFSFLDEPRSEALAGGG